MASSKISDIEPQSTSYSLEIKDGNLYVKIVTQLGRSLHPIDIPTEVASYLMEHKIGPTLEKRISQQHNLENSSASQINSNEPVELEYRTLGYDKGKIILTLADSVGRSYKTEIPYSAIQELTEDTDICIDGSEWITVTKAAELYGCRTLKNIYLLRDAGHVSAKRIGRSWFFNKDDLLRCKEQFANKPFGKKRGVKYSG